MIQAVIDHTSVVPPYAQLLGLLRGQIESGAIGPGAKLPSVRAMAGRYGLSHTTVMKVLHQLKSEGMVRGRQGAGVYVCPRTDTSAARSQRELWVESAPVNDVVRAGLTERFGAARPDFRVVESSTGSDLLWMESSFAPVHQDALFDLSCFAAEVYGRAEAGAELFDPFRCEGRLYFVPSSVNVQVIACNVDLFERYGRPLPSPDWDWDEFLRVAADVSRPSEGVYGFAALPHWDLLLPMVWQAGGAIFSEDGRKCRLDSRGAAEAGKLLRALGRHTPRWDLSSHAQLSKSMAAGAVAMTNTGVWGYHGLNHLGCRWVARPLPRGRSVATWVSARGYALTKRCRHRAAALDFIRCFVGHELWPELRDKQCGLPLHRRLELSGQTEQCYRRSLAHGRQWLSDIAPKRRRPTHMSALDAIIRYMTPLLRGDAPVRELLRDLTAEIDALISPAESPFNR